METEVVQAPKFLLRLPPDLRAELEAIANRQHRTLTNLIIHALREWAVKEEPDADA